MKTRKTRRIEPALQKPGSSDAIAVTAGVNFIQIAIGDSSRRRIAILDRERALALAIVLLESLSDMEAEREGK